MNHWKLTIVAASFAALSGTAAHADCGIGAGSVRILAGDFPALHAVGAGAAACEGGGLTVTRNHTADLRDIHVAALTPDPAEYTAAIVANSSLVPLLNNGLIRPLDELIAEHAPDLPATNRVSIGGQVMAVAFMANAQHLFVRTDILEQVGRDIPTTYEEVLETAEAIREAGILRYPFAMNTAAGWDLGEEFVNMHLGMGGAFFEPGSAMPAINNETGVATLEMLKALSAYSNPDFLTFNSNATQALWEAGELAMATMWGSRGGAVLDDEGASPEIVAATRLVAAPTVGGGDTPASSLWWDGFTIAANVPDADAAASFRALMNGISPEVVTGAADAAVWLSPAYTPGASAEGVVATAQAGARPYPMTPFMGILHTAIGNEIAQYLQGQESAEQALADAEAAYIEAARAQGFLN